MTRPSIRSLESPYYGKGISVRWGGRNRYPFNTPPPTTKKSPITEFLLLVHRELVYRDKQRYNDLGKHLHLQVGMVMSFEITNCALAKRPNFKPRIGDLLNWHLTSYLNPVYGKAGREVCFDDIYRAFNLLQSAGDDKFIEFLETGVLPGGIST